MKKVIALIAGIVVLFSYAYATDENLPFGLKIGDSFENVCETMTNIFGEGELSNSAYSRNYEIRPKKTDILGIELFSTIVRDTQYTKSENNIITVNFQFDVDYMEKSKDFSKLFALYDSLCSVMGLPEFSSHIISSVDILGNVTKKSILKYPNEFEKEITRSEVEIKETWSNAELIIKTLSISRSYSISLEINISK